MWPKRKKHLRWVVVSVLFIFLVIGSLGAANGTSGGPQGGWFMHATQDTSHCISANGGDFMVKNDGPDEVVVKFITLDAHGIEKIHKVELGKGDSTVVSDAVGRVVVDIKDKNIECKTSNGTFTCL